MKVPSSYKFTSGAKFQISSKNSLLKQYTTSAEKEPERIRQINETEKDRALIHQREYEELQLSEAKKMFRPIRKDGVTHEEE